MYNNSFAGSGHMLRNKIMLGRQLHGGTFQTKASRAGLVRVPLSGKSVQLVLQHNLIPAMWPDPPKGQFRSLNSVPMKFLILV